MSSQPAPPLHAAVSSAFAAGYLAAWFVTTVLPTKLVWYLPAEHRFTFGLHPLEVGVDLYGRLVWAALAGGLCAVIAFALLRKKNALGGALRLLAIWCVSLLLLDGGLYAFTLSVRQPVPLPLPDIHVPR